MVLQLKYFAKICSFGALRNLSIKMEFVSELWCFHLISILGDPGAASWPVQRAGAQTLLKLVW